jgi:NADPH:quinone reductase-like Zn-dependent oxidoreductase
MWALRMTVDGLNVDELEIPLPSEGEVLVRVCAGAITRGELKLPVDHLPATPLYELSGVVVAVAPDVEAVAADEEVFALTPVDRDGVASDYAVVPAAVLAPKPRTLTHVESAAGPDERADLVFDTVRGEALAAAVGCLSRRKGENSIRGGAR